MFDEPAPLDDSRIATHDANPLGTPGTSARLLLLDETTAGAALTLLVDEDPPEPYTLS